MAKQTVKKNGKDAKTIKALDDSKINVMLLGTSGSGKSTLVNAYLDTRLEKAPTGVGKAVTDKIEVYGDLSRLPFRLIDTPGLEYSRRSQNDLTRELKKWLKDSVRNPDPKTIVHTIWFCVDGSKKRLTPETIRDLKTVSDFWKDVPIIFVSTKTYFDEDVEENRKMIEKALNDLGRDKINVKAIVSVLAEEKGDSKPRGLDDLRDITEQLAPEAKDIFEKNWKEKIKTGKRLEANAVVLSRSAAAAAADAINTKGRVSVIISGIQMEMFNSIARIYEIDDDNTIKTIAGGIMGTNAVASVGKNLARRGVVLAKGKWKIAAKAVTAAVSSVITLTLGEIAIVVFESIFMGNLDIDNTDWEKYVEAVLKDKSFTKRLKKIKGALRDKDRESLVNELIDLIGKMNITK